MDIERIKRTANVLIVEDNPGDVRLILEAFKKRKDSIHFFFAKDGVEAMAFLNREGRSNTAKRPDLILLDLNLPKKNGKEVLEEIKADKQLKHIPVLVLTSSKAETDIAQAYNLNAHCFITKPNSPKQFSEVVRQIEEYWLSKIQLQLLSSNVGIRNIKVLMIDGNPGDVQTIWELISSYEGIRFVLESIDHLSDGLDLLKKKYYDVILLDLLLPDSQGIDTFYSVHAEAPDVPIVLLSALQDEELIVKAVKEGAQDYIIKSHMDTNVLVQAMLYAIKRHHIFRGMAGQSNDNTPSSEAVTNSFDSL